MLNVAEKIRPKRSPLPSHLHRETETLAAGDVCTVCGGRLKTLGEDVTEELEYVPGRFKVRRIVRPRCACADCEAMHQAPLPSRPIERGRPGPGLLAHVIVSKYADHLPLHRQSQIYGREGVDLCRSTLTDWVGRSAALLEPLADAIGDHVKAGPALFADDTPIKLQATPSDTTDEPVVDLHGDIAGILAMATTGENEKLIAQATDWLESSDSENSEVDDYRNKGGVVAGDRTKHGLISEKTTKMQVAVVAGTRNMRDLPVSQEALVAGAGFEPATFRL